MDPKKIIILPPSKLSLNIRELWEYRELFYFFTWRDIKVKYKQTFLGVLWAVLQPLSLMLLFTYLFSKNLPIETGPIRYEIFVLSGLIIWNLFYSSISNASESILQQSGVIKKIYFPRLIIPCSSILVALFDFSIAFCIYLIFCLFLRQPVYWSALFRIPLAILFTLVAAFGIGTFLSALTVKYRDFRYIIPFLLQFLFFASQIVYPLHSIHQKWLQYLLALNPANGAIELLRSSLNNNTDMKIVAIGLISAFLAALAGLFYFRKTEVYFADLA